ncbi:MAG TPA: glucose-6-phosphate isomerase [Burkholderiales bacterium]|nr:glucose-6-phosphate isomerase [Burkholderiales bacterium]
MPASRTRLPSWQKLEEHRRALRGTHLRQLFARDPRRFRRFSLEACGLLLDYSKQRVTATTLRLLAALARECHLETWIERLYSGERINTTENRAALHTALRARRPVIVEGRDLAREAREVLGRMRSFAQGVREGGVRGAGGRPFTDVLHLGIGGSALGPRLACEALAPYAGRLRLHFVSNVDGAAISAALAALDPRSTLVIIASKTFTTQETLANAAAAAAWLRRRLPAGIAVRHLCAVTAEPARAVAFGVPAERVFPFWEWVGGRYSLWSAVGLPIALAVGMERFEQMLAGAREMDGHFRSAPLLGNMPVVLGLIGVWNASFLGAASRAVLPYDERLRLLPSYLQQLEMESCGKRVTRAGAAVDYATAPATWGGTGTDSQHAWFQWLHQGTQVVPAEFIACRVPHHRLRRHHDILLANFLAQTAALAFGMDERQAAAAMRSEGLPHSEIRRLLAHRVLPGNRPTASIVLERLEPRTLGALIALYEHKVFVESVIWDVNAFDQWGVELGKTLGGRILSQLRDGVRAQALDASTRGLIRHLRGRSG